MPQTVSMTATLEVVMPGTELPLVIAPPGLPKAIFGQPYNVPLHSYHGVPPHQWSLTAAPIGFTISPDGLLRGTPMSPGEFEVTYTVTDSSE